MHCLRALLTSALLAVAAGAGCYNAQGRHSCDCDTTEASCGGTWTDQCCVPVEGLDIQCSWAKPSPRYGCSAFPENVTGAVGNHVKFAFGSANVVLMPNAAAYDSCDMTAATVLADKTQKGSKLFTMYFNTPGEYHLSTSSLDTRSGENLCEAGVKVVLIITGTATGDNTYTATTIFAPSHHANPGEDDDWEAFGKGVFHEKAYDDDLHLACPSDQPYCLDRAESKGSCYYAGEDFHIGHAVFCDVSEVDCCGYIDCSVGDNRGKHSDGTVHDYYWYAPNYRSRGTCCHCFAGCDLAAQDNTTQCKYRDITSASCQREPDPESFEMTTIGFLSCPIPEAHLANAPASCPHCPDVDGMVRKKVAPTQTSGKLEEEKETAGAEGVCLHTMRWASVLVAAVMLVQ